MQKDCEYLIRGAGRFNCRYLGNRPLSISKAIGMVGETILLPVADKENCPFRMDINNKTRNANCKVIESPKRYGFIRPGDPEQHY